MGFWRKLFGGGEAGGSNSSKAEVLICRGCGEKYYLNRVVTVSNDDVMNWLTGGGATVVGRLSGGPVMVGHSTRGPTNSGDQKTLQSLRSDPQGAWQCHKCHAKGTWKGSYLVVGPATEKAGTAPLDGDAAIGIRLARSAFERQMQRIRPQFEGDSESATVLANISKAFDRSANWVGEKVLLAETGKDSLYSVSYNDLNLLLAISVFQCTNNEPYTYFTKYGGYLEWLANQALSLGSRKSGGRQEEIFAHLIFVFHPTEQRAYAHLCITPNGRGNKSPLSVLPTDLLTRQERELAGI